MVQEQLLLFAETEKEEEIALECKGIGHYYIKLMKRKEIIHEKTLKRKRTSKIEIIDDSNVVFFREPRTEEEEKEQESKYCLSDGLLDRLEQTLFKQGVGDTLFAHHILKPEEERQLLFAFCHSENDPSAQKLRKRIRKILICMNMRLVYSIVKSRFRNYIGQGVEKDDLVQYGVEGLVRAIDGYDITKGCKLSTYATGWIQQSIQRSLDNESDMIRTPVHYHSNRGRMMVAEDTLAMERGDFEYSKRDVAQKAGITEKMIDDINSAASCACSLDATVDGDSSEGTDFGSFMIDEEADTEYNACREVLRQKIRMAIASLGHDKAYIIMQRNGFVAKQKEAMPYTTIAADLGIPTKLVQELEQEAIIQLQRILKPLIAS